MDLEDRRRKLTLLFIGLFVLFAPLLILVATIEALLLFGDIDFADLTPVELLELYLLDLVLLGLFALVLYRLLRYFLDKQLPEVIEALEAEDDDQENSR
jgi:hypothetical protein